MIYALISITCFPSSTHTGLKGNKTTAGQELLDGQWSGECVRKDTKASLSPYGYKNHITTVSELDCNIAGQKSETVIFHGLDHVR